MAGVTPAAANAAAASFFSTAYWADTRIVKIVAAALSWTKTMWATSLAFKAAVVVVAVAALVAIGYVAYRYFVPKAPAAAASAASQPPAPPATAAGSPPPETAKA